MQVGLNDAAIAPPILTRTTHALALSGGVESLWVPDHLINIVPTSVWKPKYTSTARLAPRGDAFLDPWTLLGYLAAKTRFSRLKLGVGVTDTGRRHPAVTAQAAASLHLLSRGRAILGIGCGERESNAPYGVPWDKPVARFEEALATIRALWDSDGELVNRDSALYPLRNAVFDVPPYKGTRPPIWVAAHGPRMLRLAGRYADAWYPAFFQTPKTYGERLQTVRDEAENAGRDGSSITAASWMMVVTAPTSAMVDRLLDRVPARLLGLLVADEVWREHGLEHPLGDGFTGIQDILPQEIDERTALDLASRVPPAIVRKAVLAGTPDEVLDQLAAYRDNGLTHPVLVHASLYFDVALGTLASASMRTILRDAKKL